MTGITRSAIDKAEVDRAVAGRTVPRRFLDTVAAHRDVVALRWRDGDGWGEWTFGDYAEQVARATTGLAALGVGRGDRVALMMRNRPEFHAIDVACLMLGATPISFYNSSSPEQVQYLAGHSEAAVAVVEDVGFLERFLKVRGELPALRRLVVLEDRDGLAPDDVVRGDGVLGAEPADLEAAAATAAPDDLVTVIYTSGTTGPPKGVMLTHANICWTAESYVRLVDRETAGMRVISYLPMAHIAERMASHYLGALFALQVTTCPDPTRVAEYCREVRPQSMFGVPRVWEKIHAGVQAALAADPERAQKFGEAVAAAAPLARKRLTEPLDAAEQETLDFLDAVAFKPVRQRIGFDDLELAVTGAAPIPVELLEWYRAIGVPLSEIYGMSENSGPLTWDPYEVRPGTVGRPIPGVEVRLADDGEVQARGGNVFVGYLKDEEKTREALSDDGWLCTGDIGRLDDDGYLTIVDRKKELIITAGGKNISPANLEAALKTIPLVGQACAIGDRRPYVTALLVLDPEVASAWATTHGRPGASVADLADDPEVRAEVEAGVQEVNRRFSQVEQIKRFTILHQEWLPDSEELTPTSKLKRRGIHANYAAEIERLYA